MPLFEQVTPNVPEAPPAAPNRLVDPGDRLGWEHDAVIIPPPTTARRLAELDVEIACFGHGEPLRRDTVARLPDLTR